jgi:biotin carboxylase
LEGIRLARQMGLHVVISDANPNAPGFVLANDRILASTYNPEETVVAALKYHREIRPLDGVMCIASDVPLTVACVAEALGLPGIPVNSARLAMDKLAMKEQFAANGVAVPWFSQISGLSHLRQIVAERGYPLVIKPVDSRGARGVLRLTPGTNLKWAYNVSLSHSPTARVMVEQYLTGPQVSTESMVLGGVAYTPGFADRNYELLERYAPHIIENGGQLPSNLPAETQQAIRDLVEKAANAMGIRRGVVKGDVVVHDGKPYVIELAARLSGGYFCTHEIPLNTGVDFVGNSIRLAIGDEIDRNELTPKFNRPIAQRYFFPQPGIVSHVSGAEEFSSHPDVHLLEVRVAAGDEIHPIDSHPARAGVVITSGSTRERAVALAERVAATVKIETRSTCLFCTSLPFSI